jgi:hypothetical protein
MRMATVAWRRCGLAAIPFIEGLSCLLLALEGRWLPTYVPGFRRSSNSAVSAVFTDTLASMTKHSCQAFADLGMTPDTGT